MSAARNTFQTTVSKTTAPQRFHEHGGTRIAYVEFAPSALASGRLQAAMAAACAMATRREAIDRLALIVAAAWNVPIQPAKVSRDLSPGSRVLGGAGIWLVSNDVRLILSDLLDVADANGIAWRVTLIQRGEHWLPTWSRGRFWASLGLRQHAARTTATALARMVLPPLGQAADWMRVVSAAADREMAASACLHGSGRMVGAIYGFTGDTAPSAGSIRALLQGPTGASANRP